MKKLFTLTIFLAILFFFRAPIVDFSMQFYEQDEDPIDWLGSQRADLNNDLPTMDFNAAITALQNFENEIQNNLRAPQGTHDKRSHSSRLQLLCELAVVYRHMAIQYLRDGNDNMYIEYTRKSQSQLAECSAAKEPPE